ncbi:hypothetical protein CIPAW_07G057800 [Carya illinoinensis]|uniref:KIB1-4 beta-propeller domain-containing protein n=1 Tax=Carya illinoinensis TaxID=32201 RepID=A0A8T1PZ92_CARIL|nr:hypothetical protein CIPAW_07G057800 [Carya illinoinensis]
MEKQLITTECIDQDIIIYEIAKGLVNYIDYVRFRSTCKSLQYMLPKTPNHQLNQVSCLLLPHNNGHSGRRRSLFNLLENMMFLAWLIRLPPLDTFLDVLEYCPNMVDEEYLTWRAIDVPIIYRAKKYCLLAIPTSDGKYLAMAIHGEFRDLALCRSEDKKWTYCQKDDLEIPNIQLDIMSYEGKFYVLSGRGVIWVGKGASLPKMTRLAPSPPRHHDFDPCWLVRMTSSEFVVLNKSKKWKTISHNSEELLHYKTNYFNIFKFNKKELKWTRITSIGNDAFFIGMNSLFSISLQNLHTGWRGNCIYFTDDYIDGQQEGIIGGYDNDIYKLENKRVESLPGFVFDSLLV